MVLKVAYLLMRWSFPNAELLVLRHENMVLRGTAGRVRYQAADRA
jgi:hypothetical protein